MTDSIIRIIILLVVVVVMANQAWRSPGQSFRRSAFSLASVAFGLLIVFHIKVLIDGGSGPWMIAVMWLVFLLMLVSLILLGVSWYRGEMKDKIAFARQAIEEERKKRQEQHQDK